MQNVKVNQLSDEHITQLWKKLRDSGVPETEAYKMMVEKGVPPDQVQAFKDRVTLLGLNKSQNKKTFSKTDKDKIGFSQDTGSTVIKPETSKTTVTLTPVAPALSVFGTDFFTEGAVKFEPNFNVATPKSYVLGPGDELIVLVIGLNESSVHSKVSPEGNLQIPYVGIVYVNGITIERATSLIRARAAFLLNPK